MAEKPITNAKTTAGEKITTGEKIYDNALWRKITEEWDTNCRTYDNGAVICDGEHKKVIRCAKFLNYNLCYTYDFSKTGDSVSKSHKFDVVKD